MGIRSGEKGRFWKEIMRQTTLALAIGLLTLLLVACGRFDVSVVDPTPAPGQEIADAGTTAVTGNTTAESPTTPRPSITEIAPAQTPSAGSSEEERSRVTPTATEQPPGEQPNGAGDDVVVEDGQSDQDVTVCQVRNDWPLYAVESGDTLFRIARRTGATVDDLVQANCLTDPDRLFNGQELRVPRTPVETPTPTATPKPDPWLTYEDDQYQVSFDHPAGWRDVSDGQVTRLEGDDGWVQLMAAGAPADLDAFARDQAFHTLQPFGSAPTIESYALSDGRSARLILPSADQPASMDGQSMIVTPYAEPVLIGTYPHNYFMLAADGDHIRDIGATLTLPPPTGNLIIDSFSVDSEALPGGGKRVTFRWQARGANRGVITSGTAQRFAPWWPVESAGELTVDLTSTVYPDPVMTLQMFNDVTGQEAMATDILPWPCDHDYFFQPPPQNCPLDAALVTDGAYQPFERGFMIWLPRPDLAQPSIYVFSDDGRASLFPDTWTPNDPDNELGETPPEGLFEPVGGFAKVWREHPSVREDLGWGTAEEWLYKVTYQAEIRESIPGVAYLTRPDGSIVQVMDTFWYPYVPGHDVPVQSGGLIP
jgi:LysM repeat protein